MSGHNKWSKIKRQKASEDAKKSRIFSKISRKIAIAARDGGGDPEMNPALSLLIEKAKEANMPRDNIDRAIKRGTGELKGGESMEEVTYEGYAPFGVALVIKTVTDNRNRTVAEIRTILEKSGGSLGTLGSASYVFNDEYQPTFTIPLTEEQKEKIERLLEDFEELEDVVDIYANYSKD